MPRATVDITDIKHFDLKSCPEGYVVLQRLTYGQFLERQQMATQLTMSTSREDNKREPHAQLALAQLATAIFEYKHCIKEHNLEDDAGNPLDFRQPHVVQVLDPRIGQEISRYIDEMNQLESDELGK